MNMHTDTYTQINKLALIEMHMRMHTQSITCKWSLGFTVNPEISVIL